MIMRSWFVILCSNINIVSIKHDSRVHIWKPNLEPTLNSPPGRVHRTRLQSLTPRVDLFCGLWMSSAPSCQRPCFWPPLFRVLQIDGQSRPRIFMIELDHLYQWSIWTKNLRRKKQQNEFGCSRTLFGRAVFDAQRTELFHTDSRGGLFDGIAKFADHE
jgi:hypothetical protein